MRHPVEPSAGVAPVLALAEIAVFDAGRRNVALAGTVRASAPAAAGSWTGGRRGKSCARHHWVGTECLALL